MLEGFIAGLMTAWILSWFDVDKLILDVVQPMTSTQLTSSHYYVFIGLLGIISSLFNREGIR